MGSRSWWVPSSPTSLPYFLISFLSSPFLLLCLSFLFSLFFLSSLSGSLSPLRLLFFLSLFLFFLYCLCFFSLSARLDFLVSLFSRLLLGSSVGSLCALSLLF